MINRAFWNGRRVFLTGHTGFKGSWLTLWLKKLGADVCGYALDPPTQPNLYEQANVGAGLTSITADIRDFDRLRASIAAFDPQVLLHLAAQSVVRTAYENPIETYAANVMGTVHVFEAVRQLRRPCVIVNVTSDKCYMNREVVWGYREEEPMGGRDPYSNSKGCAELVTTAFRESYFPAASVSGHGVALASARAGNAIGGGDWTKDQLIPDLMRSFASGQSCLIRNPSAIRPWQFVLEPLRGYLSLAEKLSEKPEDFASGWNFGPVESDAMPVSWIADTLARSWGGSASWTRDTTSHPKEAHSLKLDASKAAAHLGWRPRAPLRLALEWIVDWYRAFESKSDMRCVTMAQIERYEKLDGC